MSAPLELAFEKRVTEELKRLGRIRFNPEDRQRVGDTIAGVVREIYGADLAAVMVGTQAQRDAAADFAIKARGLELQGFRVEVHVSGAGGNIGVASIPPGRGANLST